jgi:hypothetical protein
VANPTWAPSLTQVAAYIPARTLEIVTDPGTQIARGTFTPSTTPSETIVNSLITDACAYVTARVGQTLADTLNDEATGATAMRVAGLVELTFPKTQDDLNTAEILLAQAETAVVALIADNAALGDGPAALLPVGRFDAPADMRPTDWPAGAPLYGIYPYSSIVY